ncbi:MAG: helix-turn-helix transcriptional regulator [Tenericutes bacterium]|nr:helix-turn-helix transcriptional regulator [Mycoplasmatota bacterium]
MDYGNRIYELRKELGLSQEKVALELNVSRQSISLWETNQASPSMDNLIALARLFNISLDVLTGLKEKISTLELEKEALYSVSYEDNKRTIYIRDFMYTQNVKGSILYGITLFFFLIAIQSIFSASSASREFKIVLFIIFIVSLLISFSVFPYYIYRNMKKTLALHNKYTLHFFKDHLVYIHPDLKEKYIDYKFLNYFIDKTDFMLLFVLKGEKVYVPKYNLEGLSGFLAEKVERRTRAKLIWKQKKR